MSDSSRWCPNVVAVHYKTVDDTVSAPEYKSLEAAGCDLIATTPLTLQPTQRGSVGTGVYLEMPPGFEAQVRPRSGLALKHGVTVLNSPGTVDSDYRGEIKVILINHGSEMFEVKKGDRIAQLVFARVYQASFINTTLSATSRGDGGFGSTGK